MALAIDNIPLAQALIPRLQGYLDQYTRRFQIHRFCVHATVIHDASAFVRLLDSRERLARQEALDWQAKQGDDLDDGEIIHHLQQQAATSPLLSRTFSPTERTTSTTTLVASALSPSFTANTQGRPASSYHRESLRCSFLNKVLSHVFDYSSAIPQVFPNAGEHYAWLYYPEPDLRIVRETNTGYKPFVVWNLQLDVVDLCSRITTYARPGKRRRTALNPFLQVSEPARSGGGGGVPEAKKIRGVRFRPERKRWVAEMRPPRIKHKASFGDFKTQTQAARAVDAAFHHYGKPHLLNFPHSTPAMLSSQPTVAGLDEKAALTLVKEQAKWLASITSTHFPAANSIDAQDTPSVCSLFQKSRVFETQECGCSVGFRSFSEISSPSFSCADDDNGSSSLHPMVDEGMFPWSPGSASARNLIETCPQFPSIGVSCMEFLVMSPPAAVCDW